MKSYTFNPQEIRYLRAIQRRGEKKYRKLRRKFYRNRNRKRRIKQFFSLRYHLAQWLHRLRPPLLPASIGDSTKEMIQSPAYRRYIQARFMKLQRQLRP